MKQQSRRRPSREGQLECVVIMPSSLSLSPLPPFFFFLILYLPSCTHTLYIAIVHVSFRAAAAACREQNRSLCVCLIKRAGGAVLAALGGVVGACMSLHWSIRTCFSLLFFITQRITIAAAAAYPPTPPFWILRAGIHKS